MQISFHGKKENHFSKNGIVFPYVALRPSIRKNFEYRSIKDVYDEIISLSEEAENKGFDVGNAIYKQSFYFVDQQLLIDQSIQNRIKEYQFCKQFNCPPYPSLQDTPVDLIDQFTIIEQEINSCANNKEERGEK